MSTGIVYLMYHEIQSPGRELIDDAPGYARYVVTIANFRAQLARLRAGNFLGLNVTDALAPDQETPVSRVVTTFDDGCETDLTVAAPLLREHNYNATFYVTTGHIGRRGYLTKSQLLELAALGFEIGCHSMSHRLLLDLPLDQLHIEIVVAKEQLEQLIGKRVAHFSCPGGRWNRRVAQVARDAGYESVATSRVSANRRTTDRFRLSRVAVMRDTSLAEFERYCRGEKLLKRQAQDAVLNVAKKALGNWGYQKFRASVLGGRGAPQG